MKFEPCTRPVGGGLVVQWSSEERTQARDRGESG